MRKLFLLTPVFLFLFPALAFAHGSEQQSSSAGDLHYSKPVEYKGRVVLLEAQRGRTGHTSLVALITSSGRQFILRGEESGDLQAGERVLVEGLLDSGADRFQSDGQVLVRDTTTISSPRIKKSITGSRGAMVAFVSWSGSGTSGYAANEASLANLTSWSESASDGLFRWDPVTRVNVVLPSSLIACNTGTGISADYYWNQVVRQKLADMGYDLSNYRALGIALPSGFAADCVSTAYAYVDSGCAWGSDYWCNLSVYSYDYSDYPTFIHEFGHTLSLPHADKAPCKENGVAVTLTYTGTCTHTEYGDRYDPMGTSFSNAMYNPAFSDQLGWIAGSEITRFEGSPASLQTDSITLKPYGGLSGTRALAIDLPGIPQLQDASPGVLYVEYRANAGLDSILYSADPAFPYVTCLAWTPASKIFFRWLPSPAAAKLMNISPSQGLYGLVDESYLLDMAPSTVTACDSGIGPGASWQDPTGSLKVSFSSRAADLSSATVSVERHVWSDSTAPSVSLQQAAGQADPTSSSPISFTLSSDEALDAATVGASDFSVTGGSVTSVSGSGTSFAISVAPSSDGTVSVAPSPSFSVADAAGNPATSASGSDRSVQYDTTAPVVSLQQAASQADPAASSPISFTLSSSESLKSASVSASDFSADGGMISSVSGSGSSYTVSVVPSWQGTVTLAPSGSFSVEDALGNAASTASGTDRAVRYDSSGPTLQSFATSSPAKTAATSVQYNLVFSEAAYGVGPGDFSFSGTASGCQAAVSGSGQSYTLVVSGCSSGTAIAKILLSGIADALGNAGFGQASASSIEFDRSTPQPTLVAYPAKTTRQKQATFSWTGEEGATFQCSLDGAAFVSCSSPKTYKNLRARVHSFRVRATDSLGNQATTSYSWTVRP